MKQSLLLLFLLMQWCVSKAQIEYDFTPSRGTYTPLAGATIATLTAAYPNGKPLTDEAFANNIPLGFSFQYNGINVSSIHLNANGFACLGAPFQASQTDPTYQANELRAATGLRGATRPVLAPFWDDLAFTSATDLTYKTEGAAPNRVFTAQWQNMSWQSTGAALSFQLKLYETTNHIEFIYRQEASAGGGSRSASIGITAEAGTQLFEQEGVTFLSLTNAEATPSLSSSVETDTITNRPATGQIYRFTPLACAAPAGLAVVSYGQNAASISWTSRAGVSSYEYGVNSIDVVPSQLFTTNQPSARLTALAPNQNYYVYVRSRCGSSWRVISFTTASTATVPYSEGFEGALDTALPQSMRSQTSSSSFAAAYWQTTSQL